MEKIKVKLLRVDEPSFFHDSRKDARTLATAINLLINKVNGLIEENNKLRSEVDNLKIAASTTRYIA